MAKYKLRERVYWRGGFGSEPKKLATITGFGEKNGRKLVDLSNGHWAYTSQISKAKRRK